ncbi:hypothetical protein M5D96_001712, partial [Drosophila gunungcola]
CPAPKTLLRQLYFCFSARVLPNRQLPNIKKQYPLPTPSTPSFCPSLRPSLPNNLLSAYSHSDSPLDTQKGVRNAKNPLPNHAMRNKKNRNANGKCSRRSSWLTMRYISGPVARPQWPSPLLEVPF